MGRKEIGVKRMRGNGKGCVLMLVTNLSQFQRKYNQKILLDAKELSQKGSKRKSFFV